MEKFLSIGHICHDRTPYEFCLGGSSAYAAITAKNLGCDSNIVTAVGPDFDRQHEKLEGISIQFYESPESTVFHNTYDENGNRNQHLLGKAEELTARHITSSLREADLVFICPIIGEVQHDVVDVFSKATIAVAPQGWMRDWDANGKVFGKIWEHAEQFLSAAEIVIVSDEDIEHCKQDLKKFKKWSPIVIRTHGYKGATLYENGKEFHFPAYKVKVVDPTGAGDIFGTAFLIWYQRTGSAEEALKFASCAASFAVENHGTGGIPTLSQIQNRVQSGQLSTL